MSNNNEMIDHAIGSDCERIAQLQHQLDVVEKKLVKAMASLAKVASERDRLQSELEYEKGVSATLRYLRELENEIDAEIARMWGL